ncbi:MAG: hypothetical protein A2138_01175 [Deltaproteobacteria bacterium RBG_16_71_12]|nr:MAG: hypothetical protein A2138_01175 [Deltaproteobacteria bacterium RBG_16_71_12]
MASRRAFTSADIKSKSDDYHGSCRFARVPSPVSDAGIKSMNLELEFEEALKLSLALTAGLHQLNRYDRNTDAGRRRCLTLSVKIDNKAISVVEGVLPKDAVM